MPTIKTIKVRERTVLSRINRNLVPKGEKVFKHRSSGRTGYYHVNLVNDSLIGDGIQIEEFARKIGVLAQYEVVEALAV